jgi:MoxR-like ATPase
MQDLKRAEQIGQRIIANIKRVIVGKDSAVELCTGALLAGGHVLIEDVPGVGKTMLARSLARSTGCSFKRIQFTPDVLPSDVTGVFIYNQSNHSFEFRPGPILSQIVLADEINRATSKTQSALLEAMEEHQVTVEGVTHATPAPFMVMATQNPVEYEGTFPLPEAQLDRFMLRVTLGYPSLEEEVAILDLQQTVHPIEALQAVTSPEEVLQIQAAVRHVYVDQLIKQYIVSVTEATRKLPDISLGASPRASLNLFRASQAIALIRGRDYVLPDDVKELAPSVLSHRIIVAPQARMRGMDPRQVVLNIIGQVPVPGARARSWLPR